MLAIRRNEPLWHEQIPKFLNSNLMIFIGCSYKSIILYIPMLKQLFKWIGMLCAEIKCVHVTTFLLNFLAMLIGSDWEKGILLLQISLISWTNITQQWSIQMTNMRLSIHVKNWWHNNMIILFKCAEMTPLNTDQTLKFAAEN